MSSARASIHIRPFVPTDRAFCLGLAPRLVIGAAWWRDAARMLSTMERFIGESSAVVGAEAALFVAEDVRQGRVGFVSVAHGVDYTGAEQAYVGELAVGAEAEGGGVGRALMGAAEEWGRARGYRIVALDVGAANAGARAFYRRLGYEEDSVRLVKLVAP